MILERVFHKKANLEAVYLLGDFGVRVTGRSAVITEPVKNLEFGDWTTQGLPFYGGNVTYHLEMEEFESDAVLEISKFRAPLLSVRLNGEERGILAFSPYQLKLKNQKREKGHLEITAFGNRINTFGALHNSDLSDNKADPNYWRTKGCAWSYEYCLRKSGILKSPVIKIIEEKK